MVEGVPGDGGEGSVVVRLSLLCIYQRPPPPPFRHPTTHLPFPSHPSCRPPPPPSTTPGEKWFINSKSSIFWKPYFKGIDRTESGVEWGMGELRGREKEGGGQSQGVWRGRVCLVFWWSPGWQGKGRSARAARVFCRFSFAYICCNSTDLCSTSHSGTYTYRACRLK